MRSTPRKTPQQPQAAPDTAVCYCRVSTEGQERDGTSLDTQEQACRVYAATRGWTVVAVVRDTKSGATLERPGLDRARAMLRNGEAAVLLSYAVDRLSRDQDQLGVVYDGVRRAGAQLEFVTEKFADTPVGRFLLGSFAFVAQMERLNIADRMVRGKRGRLESGKLWGGGMDLYGYRRDAAHERRTAYEPEAVHIRSIFRMCVEERMPTRAIAKRLIAQGIPSPVAGKRRSSEHPQWTRGGVYRLLTNVAYTGVTHGWRWTTNERGRIVQRPESEWVLLPASVSEAIVSAEVFERAQLQLRQNNRNATRNARRPYLLKGMVSCRCGRKMYGGAGGRYTCNARDFLEGKCGAPSIMASILEPVVWAALETGLRDPALMVAAVQVHTQASAETADASWDAEIIAVRQSLAATEQRVQRAVDGYLSSPYLAREAFQRHQNELAREHRRLTVRLEELEQRAEQAAAAGAAVLSLPEWCARWRGNLAALDFLGRREVLELLGVRVTVQPQCIRIEGAVALDVAASVAPQAFGQSRHNRTAVIIPFVLMADRAGRLIA